MIPDALETWLAERLHEAEGRARAFTAALAEWRAGRRGHAFEAIPANDRAEAGRVWFRKVRPALLAALLRQEARATKRPWLKKKRAPGQGRVSHNRRTTP